MSNDPVIARVEYAVRVITSCLLRGREGRVASPWRVRDVGPGLGLVVPRTVRAEWARAASRMLSGTGRAKQCAQGLEDRRNGGPGQHRGRRTRGCNG